MEGSLINLTVARPRLAATVQIRPEAQQRLGAQDRLRLDSAICNTIPHDGRSTSFSLVEPFEIDGRPIQGLRLKGIAPDFDHEGNLRPHTGDGSVAKPFIVDRKGVISTTTPTIVPQGTNLMSRVNVEWETSMALGGLADAPIALGTYKGLSFNGEPVGFTVVGMEHPTDLRFFGNFIYPSIEKDTADDLPPLCSLQTDSTADRFIHFGKAVHAMHSLGMVHRYMHLDNVGILPRRKMPIAIRDLDTARRLNEMTPEQRIGYLFLDLGRVAADLVEMHTYDPGEGEPSSRFNLSCFFRPFSEGYFGLPISQSFDPSCLVHPLVRVREYGETVNALEWSKDHGNIIVRAIFDYLIQEFAPELG